MARKTLQREWLRSLGITYVSDDGLKVMKGSIELTQTVVTGKHKYGEDKQYKVVQVYDHEYYLDQLRRHCKHPAGMRALLVSRVVFAWKWGMCPGDRDVDHIDDNPFNNHYTNLQLLTRAENLAKRKKSHKQIYEEYMTKKLSKGE